MQTLGSGCGIDLGAQVQRVEEQGIGSSWHIVRIELNWIGLVKISLRDAASTTFPLLTAIAGTMSGCWCEILL
jgi:hypothetical protein